MYARVITLALVFIVLVIGIEIAHRATPTQANWPIPVFASSTAAPTDQLAMRIGDIDFTDVPLKAAIETLAIRSRKNLGCDWQTLETDGISAIQPVTMHLRNPTLSTALAAICDEVDSPLGKTAGFGEDPRGLLWLGSSDGYRQSIMTVPRFYELDDLIGPTVAYHSPTEQDQAYPLAPPQVRPDLRQLVQALQPFVHRNDIGCFGRRLFVSGYLESHRFVAEILENLRKPIQLSDPATAQPSPPKLPKVPEFDCPPGTTGRRAWEMWQQAGAGRGILEIGPESDDSLEKTFYFLARDLTIEEIAVELIRAYGWPFIVVRAGEEDNRIHVRRVPLEPVIRAYDVSAILAHPDGWIADARSYSGDDPSELNQSLLTNFVLAVGQNDPPALSNSSDNREAAFCWKGILLMQAPPIIHDHVLRFLKHLQRTGRPFDPPGDQ